jgi:hypothetical protein
MTTLGISEDNDDDIANAVRVCMQSQIPPPGTTSMRDRHSWCGSDRHW